MKKIKFLNRFLITLLLLFVSGFFMNFYNFRVFKGILYFDFIMYSCFALSIIIGLFFVQRALSLIIKNGIFNNIAAKKLKNGGLFFLISGLGSILYRIIIFIRKPDPNSEFFFSNVEKNFLLIMIGFSIYIMADVIKNGNLLKQENELTI